MKKTTLLLGALAALAFASCQPEEEELLSQPVAMSVVIKAHTLEFAAKEAPSQCVSISSNRNWNMKNVPEWVSVSVQGKEIGSTVVPASKKAVDVEIAVLDNEGVQRSATIIFNGGTKQRTLIIKQEGSVESAKPGDGSKENPFLASQANEEALKLASGATSATEYYIRGIVHKVKTDTQDNIDKYGNLTFYISDDGNAATNDFCCFQMLGLNKAKFTSNDDIKVGDDVVICGKITNYNGTAETVNKGAAYVYSINGNTGSGTGGGTETTEMTIDQVIAAASGQVKTTGKIVFASSKEAFINDGSENNLYIYTAPTGFNVGDVVTVEGTASTYNGLVEVKNATYTASTASISVNTKAAKELSGAELDSYTSASSELISFEGTLAISGNYKNVTVSGATIKGSVYTSEDLSAYNGMQIKATGYFAGKSASYLTIVATEVIPSAGDYFNLSATTINVGADAQSASFSIATNLAWTATCDNAAITLSATSGTGAATIDLSFSKNTDTTAVKTATITVTTELGVKTVAFTQAKASNPNAKTMELTNAEIKTALSTYGTGAYATITIASASGNWEANVYSKTDYTYLQFRNKQGSFIKSPVFTSNVSKVEITLNARTSPASSTKYIYAVPADTTIPTDNNYYPDATYTGAYGFVEAKESSASTTVTIEFTGSTKQFVLLPKSGANYIDSIKVYF